MKRKLFFSTLFLPSILSSIYLSSNSLCAEGKSRRKKEEKLWEIFYVNIFILAEYLCFIKSGKRINLLFYLCLSLCLCLLATLCLATPCHRLQVPFLSFPWRVRLNLPSYIVHTTWRRKKEEEKKYFYLNSNGDYNYFFIYWKSTRYLNDKWQLQDCWGKDKYCWHKFKCVNIKSSIEMQIKNATSKLWWIYWYCSDEF